MVTSQIRPEKNLLCVSFWTECLSQGVIAGMAQKPVQVTSAVKGNVKRVTDLTESEKQANPPGFVQEGWGPRWGASTREAFMVQLQLFQL